VIPALLEPIVRLTSLKPVKFFDLGGGKYSWAFEQNYGGYAELDVPGAGFSNATLTMHVGEETDGNGSATNGRSWWQNMGRLSWTLRGEKVETLRQTFMFMGFQYVAVEGWPVGMPKPTIESMRGVPTSVMSERHQVGELVFDGVTPSAAIAASFGSGSGSGSGSSSNGAAAMQAVPSEKLNGTILAGVFHAIIWGQVSNFQSIPGDCPNREKQ